MTGSTMLILRGVLASAAFIGTATVAFRILGFGRGEALYLACLSFVITAYVFSRRALQRQNRD